MPCGSAPRAPEKPLDLTPGAGINGGGLQERDRSRVDVVAEEEVGIVSRIAGEIERNGVERLGGDPLEGPLGGAGGGGIGTHGRMFEIVAVEKGIVRQLSACWIGDEDLPGVVGCLIE